jgi:hypothetical protein
VVIETRRLLLRRATIDDVDELVGIHADPDVKRVFGTFDYQRAIEWLRRFDHKSDLEAGSLCPRGHLRLHRVVARRPKAPSEKDCCDRGCEVQARNPGPHRY